MKRHELVQLAALQLAFLIIWITRAGAFPQYTTLENRRGRAIRLAFAPLTSQASRNAHGLCGFTQLFSGSP